MGTSMSAHLILMQTQHQDEGVPLYQRYVSWVQHAIRQCSFVIMGKVVTNGEYARNAKK